MGIERQVKYQCDCSRYHGYKENETLNPKGWLSAVVKQDIDGHDEIIMKRASDLVGGELDEPGRLYFMGTECLEAWVLEFLFPIKPAVDDVLPAVVEKAVALPEKTDMHEAAATGDVPF